MQLFLTAFKSVPDPRAENVRHDLIEIVLIAFLAVLCGAQHCSEMAAFGRAKIKLLKRFLKLKRGIPSHDTFSTVLRMLDPKALDAAFGRLTATLAAALAKGGVIAIDGKSLKGAYDKGGKSSPRMMVSAYAAGLRLSLATVEAKDRNEVDAALDVLGLIDLKGKIVTTDALHCNRRMVSTIVEKGGDYCIALKGNQESLLSDARACLGKAGHGEEEAASGQDRGHRSRPHRDARGGRGRRQGDGRASRVCGPQSLRARREYTDDRRRDRDGGALLRAVAQAHAAAAARNRPRPLADRTRCIGSSTSRSARTPLATARTTARPTSPSCAAAPSTQPASTRARDRWPPS
jgi:hypothetical protein